MGRMKNDIIVTENSGNYFQWLCNIIGTQRDGKDYYLVLHSLFDTGFVYFVRNDDNRYFDALTLRLEYSHVKMGIPVNVLEVLIVLARHMDDQTFDIERGESVNECFWEMLTNLGLMVCDDSVYDGTIVDSILKKWLQRKYDKDGKDGLFPIKKSGVDQTKQELWYQMAEYLLENHSF